MIDRRKNVEWSVSGVLAIMVTCMVAVAALAPYTITIPQTNLNLITQAQTTLWNGWLLVLGFYFGTSQSQGKKDAAIATLADTAQKAQAALAPVPGVDATVTLKPGEAATVAAEQSKDDSP